MIQKLWTSPDTLSVHKWHKCGLRGTFFRCSEVITLVDTASFEHKSEMSPEKPWWSPCQVLRDHISWYRFNFLFININIHSRKNDFSKIEVSRWYVFWTWNENVLKPALAKPVTYALEWPNLLVPSLFFINTYNSLVICVPWYNYNEMSSILIIVVIQDSL